MGRGRLKICNFIETNHKNHYKKRRCSTGLECKRLKIPFKGEIEVEKLLIPSSLTKLKLHLSYTLKSYSCKKKIDLGVELASKKEETGSDRTWLHRT